MNGKSRAGKVATPQLSAGCFRFGNAPCDPFRIGICH